MLEEILKSKISYRFIKMTESPLSFLKNNVLHPVSIRASSPNFAKRKLIENKHFADIDWKSKIAYFYNAKTAKKLQSSPPIIEHPDFLFFELNQKPCVTVGFNGISPKDNPKDFFSKISSDYISHVRDGKNPYLVFAFFSTTPLYLLNLKSKILKDESHTIIFFFTSSRTCGYCNLKGHSKQLCPMKKVDKPEPNKTTNQDTTDMELSADTVSLNESFDDPIEQSGFEFNSPSTPDKKTPLQIGPKMMWTIKTNKKKKSSPSKVDVAPKKFTFNYNWDRVWRKKFETFLSTKKLTFQDISWISYTLKENFNAKRHFETNYADTFITDMQNGKGRLAAFSGTDTSLHLISNPPKQLSISNSIYV